MRLPVVLLTIGLLAGCGQSRAPVVAPFVSPVEFSDDSGSWLRFEDALSQKDNQKIGAFFKKNESLVGSPEWTGEPEKYVCTDRKSLERFYWFSGSSENPSWNAIEVNGSRVRKLSGQGPPGIEGTE
jgi:hypothetical protein